MKCHNHNQDNGKRHHSHIWMMALCCGLPLLLLLLLPVLSSALNLPPGALRTAVTFLCPALMLLMCFVMIKDHKSANNNKNDDNAECKSIEEGKVL